MRPTRYWPFRHWLPGWWPFRHWFARPGDEEGEYSDDPRIATLAARPAHPAVAGAPPATLAASASAPVAFRPRYAGAVLAAGDAHTTLEAEG